MPKCQEMKVGETYWCPDCGFEIKVMEECTHQHGKDIGHDECDQDGGLTCCGKPLQKK